MCLAVPGKILSLGRDAASGAEEGGASAHAGVLVGGGSEGGLDFVMGEVDFAGVVQSVSLAYVPEAQVGDYVIVHAGIAISRLDEAAALRSLETFAELADSVAEDTDT